MLALSLLPGCESKPAKSLGDLYSDGVTKLDQGDLRAALSDAEQGRKETESKDPVQNWRFRLLQAEILLWQGRTAESAHLLDSPPPQLASNHELLIRTKLSQGRALYGAQHSAAAALLDEAERLATASNPELLGDVTLAQGTFAHIRHNYDAAQADFQRALQLARQYHRPLLEAKVLGSLARLSTTLRHYDEAIDGGTASLSLSESIHARHVEAATRLNIGWSYLELGDFEQAIPLFNASEALAADAGMRQVQREALNSLGRLYFNQGNSVAAADYYKRALALARDLHDEAATATYLDNIAQASLALGHVDEADGYNHDALKMKREIGDRSQELRSLSTEASIADARKQFSRAASILDSVLADKDTPAAVRWEACHELASLYVQTGKRAQAQAEFKKGLAFLDRSWDAIGKDENKFSFSTWAKDFYTDYIRFLVARHDPIGAMQVAESMRARTLEEALGKSTAKHPPLPVIQNFLRTSRKIILAYWLAPEHSYLWVVTPAHARVFILPSKQEIETRVGQYQHSVTTLGDVESTDPTGQELYRILIAPAQKMLPPKAQVVVIPDGSLGKLNFETLIAPQPSPHFWIDDVQIEAANSMALLVSSRSSQQHPHMLLAIGDPVEVTSDYPRLKYAAREIKAATEHFAANKPKIVSEAAATPSSYAQSVPGQYDLIHFATHGFASETRPLESAIILSPDKDKSFKLYGRDIVKIPLKADIVTISACYGAGKRTYSGEGLVGLAWAFLRAGAHQVIAGLWDVEDQPTPELMQNFYSELANGKSAAVALHDAKLKMLHSAGAYRLPYYWAALQLYVGS